MGDKNKNKNKNKYTFQTDEEWVTQQLRCFPSSSRRLLRARLPKTTEPTPPSSRLQVPLYFIIPTFSLADASLEF